MSDLKVNVKLHCLCGESFVDEEDHETAKIVTQEFWDVHQGPGHGYSPVHVVTHVFKDPLEVAIDIIELLCEELRRVRS